MEATPETEEYFRGIEEQCQKEFQFASLARRAGCDPEQIVEISLAKNMAERVVGLISVIAPQIKNSGVVERIIELEKEYGALDWRVSLLIALEVAQGKFCGFADKKEAIEVGIRTGFAYSTVGVVSSPLDGLINIEFKQRHDRTGEYLCLNYAGPIRNAGGTNAALSVLIGDFVRKKMGYSEYDADEMEVNRAKTELQDYHERVTNLQYKPSEEETEFLMSNLPVEINGDPSEKIEVSNYKDLPRVKTNLIRSGYCLLLSSCIPLKAEKLWKQLNKWGHDFSMEQWDFLEEFCKLKKKMHAKGEGGSKAKEARITPDHTYISDLPAGRPVLGHPLAKGAFRLRYGRSRTSGYSAQSIHPATMRVLNNFIATGSQLKSERPGKGTVVSVCDTIEGPIVKLDDGSVMRLESEADARIYKKRIAEVLFLGDLLINYGDFFNRAHLLCPAGYCEEWWIQEFEKAVVSMFGTIDSYRVSELVDVKEETISMVFSDFLRTHPDAFESVAISEKLNIPLHPYYTFHWADISVEQLSLLVNWLKSGNASAEDNRIQKIILKKDPSAKIILEALGVPHTITPEFIIIQKDFAHSLLVSLGLPPAAFTGHIENIQKVIEENKAHATLEIINKISSVKIRDKSGIYIGSRMGRPEKAKMRKLRGSPHVLFPVGTQGGKMRSVQSALAAGRVIGDFAIFNCVECGSETVFSVCEKCGSKTKKAFFCSECSAVIPSNTCPKHGTCAFVRNKSVDIRHYFNSCIKKLNLAAYPDLIKGVKGTSNEEHIPEHLIKGILRAKHSVYVNKDGTIRFDCTELACTHFKPKEIRTSVAHLIELGYSYDIKGSPLKSEEQILELKPQDVILPAPVESPDEPSDAVFFRVCAFIDELLAKLYDSAPFYNLKSKNDLVGQLIIGLAPHTSAGIIGRIIGFSKHQVFLAHPYFHAACRRDCDGDELGFLLLMDAFLNFSKKYLPSSRGSTMDCPLVLTSVLNPAEVDDMVFDVDIAWRYPLEFYEATLAYKMPWDVKIAQIKATLGTSAQYEGMGFTHDTSNFNDGVACSAYKILPSMEEKLREQMDLAEKLRCVEASDVARLVIEKHFIRDIRGNLRKFPMQQFRCVNCNEKYRRVPLAGKCVACSGKLIFTISEGFVTKYLGPSISLANKYNVSDYLKQSLLLTKQRIEGVFGKEREKQEGLGKWFG